jgi:hypothetical protein
VAGGDTAAGHVFVRRGGPMSAAFRITLPDRINYLHQHLMRPTSLWADGVDRRGCHPKDIVLW